MEQSNNNTIIFTMARMNPPTTRSFSSNKNTY